MAEGYSWSDKPASDEAALVAQVKVHATPLEPLDTGVEPILPRLPGIKAVVFDIYGTLIISGTGDISLAANSDREESFRWALEAGGFAATADARDQGIRLSEVFHAEIEANRQRTIAAGTPFPEIEIREIWASALAGMLSREEIADRSSQGITPARIERMAVEFEVRVNPVWAMPDLVEMLTVLRKQGLKLGIVSNAQFYTPWLEIPSMILVSRRTCAFGPLSSARANPRVLSIALCARNWRLTASSLRKLFSLAMTCAMTLLPPPPKDCAPCFSRAIPGLFAGVPEIPSWKA